MAQQHRPINRKQLQASLRSWIDARQHMMIAFNHLCLLKPFADAPNEELYQAVENFCTDLVDYLSYGQFKVFEGLSETIPAQGNDAKIVKNLLGKIFSSTVQSVEFQDKYTRNNTLKNLEQDLLKLGSQLSSRLDWEDQLLELALECAEQSLRKIRTKK